MNTRVLCIFLISGVVFADTPTPTLLTTYIEKAERLTEQARNRKKVLVENNQRALEQLVTEGIRRPDPALRLWAECDRSVQQLSTPGGVRRRSRHPDSHSGSTRTGGTGTGGK